MNVSPAIVADVTALMEASGSRKPARSISVCSSGGNNRIYRVVTDDDTFAAKQYFRHELDTRDRLGAEYSFLTYAASAAPRITPRPHACSRERGMALYEFVEGRHLRNGEVHSTEIEAALEFFRALNDPAKRPDAAPLPAAAEACFSITEHIALVGGRIRLLSEAAESEGVDGSATAFVRTLGATWERLAAQVMRKASASGIDPVAALAGEQRCVSPSDFGFHNALVERSGAIRFIDFEYAGWDDPAKTAGDFFAQLAIPVPQEFFCTFVDQMMSMFPRPEELVTRAHLLRPVYRMKWCCIALNVLHPVHLARRRFADPSLDEAKLMKVQLEKAEQLFSSMSLIGV